MNEYQSKNNGTGATRVTSISNGIPIEFANEVPLHFPVKIQSLYSMNKPSRISEKSIIPALFQIAAQADDVKLSSALRNVLTLKESSVSERMLDREKLEGILKAIAKRKKTARR